MSGIAWDLGEGLAFTGLYKMYLLGWISPATIEAPEECSGLFPVSKFIHWKWDHS
jgi:hypothetical protein